MKVSINSTEGSWFTRLWESTKKKEKPRPVRADNQPRMRSSKVDRMMRHVNLKQAQVEFLIKYVSKRKWPEAIKAMGEINKRFVIDVFYSNAEGLEDLNK